MTRKVHLDHNHLRHLLKAMIRIRHFEAKCVELYQAQKILGFLHLYDGEEAVSVGVMEALEPQDAVIATYREHGQALARGVDPGCLMGEMLGKLNGCCRGRGGSMHFFHREHRFYGGNAIVGGGLPLALGVALGDKMQGRNGRHGLLLRRRRGGRRRIPRDAQSRQALASAHSFRVREQSLCDGHGGRARRSRHRLRPQGVGLQDRRRKSRRDGRRSRGKRGAQGHRADPRRRAIPIFSNAGPIVFARTRCSTPSFTARRKKSRLGARRGLSAGSKPGSRKII